MRYWWVNQNQTYRHEVPGGYLWSPKVKTNGHANAFYDFMREVAPGDIVFSFSDTWIKAIGVVASHCYEAPKPKEFGQVGAYWETIGWRVDVKFRELHGPIKPSSFMDRIGPKLPSKYSPLQPNGNGLQAVYLTVVNERLAETLVDLIGREARTLVTGVRVQDVREMPTAIGLAEWEEHALSEISQNKTIPETTRLAVVLARRGQGLFKQNVMRLEAQCRITGVDQMEHLRASHCKPWRDSSNEERLNGENGLLLTPNADHLFDRGFISFENNGKLLISPVAHQVSLHKMGIDVSGGLNVGAFSSGQSKFLDFHRESVFLESRYISR
jgi:putative restriction endonuclease